MAENNQENKIEPAEATPAEPVSQPVKEEAPAPAAEPTAEPTAETPAENSAEPAHSDGKKADKKSRRAAKPKAGKKNKRLKVIIGICLAAALCGTGLGVGLMFIPKESLVINEGYASVSYEVENGETFSPDKNYTGLEIFGKLNWTFQHKEEWYSSYQGYVYTMVNQDVKTVKQFKDGRLISTDISTSSMVNVAREFCYIPSADRVIWREASGGPATYNGFDTPWKTGDPVGNMTISGPEGFKVRNGLPATELSVYVFQEGTILSADPVVDNSDGTYTITYHMNPEVWQAEDGSFEGAAAYYSNQMKFTGGLTDVPEFSVIDISFTFNENWENLKTEAHEEYEATMGVSVGCRADGVTEYSYDTPYLPFCNDYENYFKKYAEMEATGAPDPTIDSMSALTAAFGPVIQGPSKLALDLTVGGKPVDGVIYVDLGTNGGMPSFEGDGAIQKFIDNLDVRAKLGNLKLYVDGGAAYVSAGDWKLKLTVSELNDLLGGLLGGASPAQAELLAATTEEPAASSNPLADILNGEFTYDKETGKAHMHSVLALGGVTIPIDFNYNVEAGTLAVSLDNVKTSFTLGDLPLSANIGFTDKAALEPLSDEEAKGYTELATHIKNIVALLGSDVLHADVTYKGTHGGAELKVEGGVDLAIKGELKAQADLTVTYGGKEKKASIGYEKNTVYLDLDGVKLAADVQGAAALIAQYLPVAAAMDEEGSAGFSLSGLIDTLLFSTTLVDDISVTGDETALQAVIKADELIKAFGFDLGSFDLGTIILGVSGQELSVSALGAGVTLKAGNAFQVNTEGYSEVLGYVQAVLGIIQSESKVLQADVSYTGVVGVTGTLKLNIGSLAELAALGEFTVTYGDAQKQVTVIYTENALYLDIDGLQLAADVENAVGLVQSLLAKAEPAAAQNDELGGILEKLFSFRLGDVITVEATQITVKGTDLLTAFGMEFALGDVTLTAGEDTVTLTAETLGVTVTLKAGEAFDAEAPGYVDIVDYAGAVAQLIKGGSVAADITYSGLSDRNIGVTGEIAVDISDFNNIKAAGTVTVTYGKAEKKIGLAYAEGAVQLNIDGLGLSAGVKDAVALVQGLLAKEEPTALADDGLGDILTTIFSFHFDDVITEIAEEGETLKLTVAGTDLLAAFGVPFELGQVQLGIAKNGTITAEAEGLGLSVTLSAGTGEALVIPDYVNIVEYAGAVAQLIKGDCVAADITYSGLSDRNIDISGNITVNLGGFKEISAVGTVTVSYGEAQKQVAITFAQGVLSLDIDGLQLSAGVKDAVALVKGLLAKEEPAALADDELGDILTTIFSFNFGDVITEIAEENETLKLTVAGTELLDAFGVPFELGQVQLGIAKSGEITAKAEGLGVTVTLSAGTPTVVEDPGYIKITDYVAAVAQLIKGGYVAAHISYTGYGLTVSGDITLNINDFSAITAKGSVQLQYGELDKTVGVTYAGGKVYLTIDELKLAAEVNSAVEVVTGMLTAAQPAAIGEEEQDGLAAILTKVFSITFGDYITLSEEGTTMSLSVAGTNLLTALGMQFELGQVQLDVTKDGQIAVKAKDLGANITVKAGDRFDLGLTESDYTSVTPVIGMIPELMNAKAIALDGAFFITVGETEIALSINKGVISWSEGFRLYLDAKLELGETALPLLLDLTESGVQANICGYGVKLLYSDLSTLEADVMRLYRRVFGVIGNMLEKGDNPLPDVSTFSELLEALKGLSVVAAAADGAAEDAETKGFDWTQLVQSIKLGKSEKAGGIAHAEYQGVSLDILDKIDQKGGFLGLCLGYTSDKFSLTADIGAKVHTGTIEALPEADLTAAQMQNFLGYIGSAIDLFETTDLTLTFEGDVTSTDKEAYPPKDGETYGVKYKINASMSTHRGASDLLHLDVEGKNLWVDTDVFAHASINIVAQKETDSSLYIDLYIVDGAPKENGGNTTFSEGDGMLDFYVTLSQYGPIGSIEQTVPGYNPVRLYAPSDEILTLLSAAVTMLGADADAISPIIGQVMNGFVGTMLNDYMVSKWITDEAGKTDAAALGRLKAFGNLIAPLLGNLLGGSGAEEGEPAMLAALAEAEAPATGKEISVWDYLKELTVGEEGLNITLNSKAVYGLDGLSDVKATLTKEADATDAEGNYTYGKFKTLDLLNIYDKSGTLNTSLKGTVSYEHVEPEVGSSGTYRSFLGAEKLLLSLAKSATHEAAAEEVISGEEAQHTYKLNNNFYIDGSIAVGLHLGDLDLIKINIDIIAISVTIDESGSIALNLRLEYKGNYSTLAAVAGLAMGIDGNIVNGTSTVDLTLKNGMVYMKRVQTTDSKNKDITPVTLYRAMPAANFTGNILDHIQFLFNLGDKLWTYINGQINKSSGGEETPAEKIDFGQRLSDVLSAYTFTPEGTGEDGSLTPASWDLTLNGDAFLKDVLGDINIVLKEGEDGYFHDIKVNLGMIPLLGGNLIDASLDLRWRNPGGTMEEGASDKTQSGFVSDLEDATHGLGGMIEKLNAENGWTETQEDGTTTYKFLEASPYTVAYKYRTYAGAETDFSTPQQQNVMVSSGQGGWDANTLFSVLEYPELPDDGKEFYVADMEHVEVGEVLRAVLFAQQYKHTYTVKFWADESLGEDWTYDQGTGKWWRKFDMEYGAKVTFIAKDEEFQDAYTVTDDNTQEVTLPARPAYAEGQDVASEWTVNFNKAGTEFKVLYKIDTVKYSSPDVAFTVDGNDNLYNDYSAQFTEDTYTLITPKAAGYTFLGWFLKDAEGKWSKVQTVSKGTEEVTTTEVQALWVSDLTVTITKAERSNELNIFGARSYEYSIEADIKGGKLVGAFAQENVSLQMTYRFEAWTSDRSKNSFDTTHTADEYVEHVIGTSSGRVTSRDNGRVYVTIAYTYGDVFTYTTAEVYGSSTWTTIE